MLIKVWLTGEGARGLNLVGDQWFERRGKLS